MRDTALARRCCALPYNGDIVRSDANDLGRVLVEEPSPYDRRAVTDELILHLRQSFSVLRIAGDDFHTSVLTRQQ